jgi:hypothetical protein
LSVGERPTVSLRAVWRNAHRSLGWFCVLSRLLTSSTATEIQKVEQNCGIQDSGDPWRQNARVDVGPHHRSEHQVAPIGNRIAASCAIDSTSHGRLTRRNASGSWSAVTRHCKRAYRCMRTRAQFMSWASAVAICTAVAFLDVSRFQGTMFSFAGQLPGHATTPAPHPTPAPRSEVGFEPATSQASPARYANASKDLTLVGLAPAVARPVSASPTRVDAPEPRVVLDGSLLSIVAKHSTLGDVLRAVRSATGATVDFPGDVSESVDVDIGPAEARDVLAALLNSSRFDYVLVGSDQNLHAISRIILAERRDPGVTASTSNSPVPDRRTLVAQQPGVSKQRTQGMNEIMQQQQRQFERQFADCKIQGCDAS